MAFNRAGFTQAAKAMGYNDDEINQIATIREAQEESNPANQPVKTYSAPTVGGQSTTTYQTPDTTYNAPNVGNQGTMAGQTTKTISTAEKRQKLLDMGYSEADVNKALGIQVNNQKTPMIEQPKSIGGFVGNIFKSGFTNVRDIAKSIVNVANPNLEENTIANLGRLGLGTIQLAIPGKQKSEEKPKALAQFYIDRYGSWDKAKEAIYSDPVGVALDASVVFGGVGSTLNKISKTGKISSAGKTLTKTSKVIDPLAQTGKQLPKITQKAGKVKQATAEKLALKSSKIAPAKQLAFKEITGKDVGAYMTEKKLFTVGDVAKTKTTLQNLYNDFTRTGKTVSGSVFAKHIRKQANDLIKRDKSLTARTTAAKLLEEAKYFDKQANLTDTLLTNTKSGYWGGVPQSKIIDPTELTFNKAMGKAGLSALDEIAPGASRIGKELQALTTLEDMLARGSYIGKQTNILNLLKPYGAGAGAGYLIGDLPGAVVGGLAGIAVDSPVVQRILSKTLSKKIPQGVKTRMGEIAGKTYEAGKASSRLLPEISQNLKAGQVSPETRQMQEPSTYSDSLPQSPQDVKLGQTYATGQSPEYWNAQYQQAMSQSPIDDVTAKYALEQRNYETQYQKGNIKKEKGNQSDTALLVVQELKNLYTQVQNQGLTAKSPGLGRIAGSIKGNIAALTQDSPEAANYKDQVAGFISLVVRGLGEKGVLTDRDVNRVKKSIPKFSDTPAKAADGWKRVISILQKASEKEASQQELLNDLYINQGLGAYPPQL